MQQFLYSFLFLITIFPAAYLIRFSIFSIPTTALEILIFLFVALVIYRQWGRFRPVPRSIVWPVTLFLLTAVISTVIAPDTRAALGILKAWIVDPLLFAWAIYQLPDREATIRLATSGLVAGGALVALVAIMQKLTGQVTVDGRVLGPYGFFPAENASPNYLALYLAPIGVLASGLAAESLLSKRWSSGLAFTTAFTMIALALLFSLSRAGLAALVIGIAAKDIIRFWPWIRLRSWAKLTLLGLMTVVLIGGWYLIRPDPTLSPEVGGRITASNNVRWEIWRTTTEILRLETADLRLPILISGVGLGNYQDYFTELTRGRVNYDRIAPLALTPHNLFLSTWVNLGLLGLISIVWLLIDIFRRLLRRAQDWTVAALLGSLIALLAHGLLDTPYFKNDLALLFWTLVVLPVLLSERKEETKDSKRI